MPGKFKWCKFGDCNLDDPFFDSLKTDYPEFSTWFARKAGAGEHALVFHDENNKIGAFLYVKPENETIELTDNALPAKPRLKIGTLKLDDRVQGVRLGEGALGVALWHWQEQRCEEVYLTVYDHHTMLISLLERFGFVWVGTKANGERVYLRSRANTDYSDSYKAFPFLTPNFNKAGIIPIKDIFHDLLFPYSELYGQKYEIEEITAGNGITKIYVGSPYSPLHYQVGEPVLIYRIFTGDGQKTFKSVVTSFGVVTGVEVVKATNRPQMSLRAFIEYAGNKTVFTEQQLSLIYNNNRNVIMLEMIYSGYFGKGHNVTHRELDDKGLFGAHPYNIEYTLEEFKEILRMGDRDVRNIIID